MAKTKPSNKIDTRMIGPDGCRNRRHHVNEAKRTFYARHRAERFAKRFA